MESKILLLLGVNVSTIYFAKEFVERNNVVAVIQQDEKFPFKVPNIFVERGKLNDDLVIQWARQFEPDIFISYGPERIGKGLISLTKFGGINIHWGLSPMYRGMHTSRWALLEGLPEYVGVTIHKVDENLDTGDIIFQARPEMEEGDSFRTIEHRLSLLACSLIQRAVEIVVNGGILCKQDTKIGRQYWAKQWTTKEESKLNPLFISKLLRDYNDNKVERDGKVELINYE